MIKKFDQFVNENDSTINWEEIEEVCMNTPDLPDCVPTNIRQWDNFIKQYERIVDLINRKWEPHYNWETQAEFIKAVDEQFYLGKGYKHSIYECYIDIAKIEFQNLFKNVDWNIIRIAFRFTIWNIHIGNLQLTKLPLLPRKVGGLFECSRNNLTSLKGAPNYVGRSFYCSNNNLTSLKYAPNYVGDIVYCYSNKLPDSIPDEFNGLNLQKYINL